MKRFVLRNASNPPTDFPNRIRGSTLGKDKWCEEQVRHKILGLIPEKEEVIREVIEIGTIEHRILEESMGKRFPWEQRFMEKLQEYQHPEFGFFRKIHHSKIYHNLTGHPDDLQITLDPLVSIVEHKTVVNPNEWFIKRFKLCMARFQSQVYSWILEPYVQKLGGAMNRVNGVCFWHQETFKLIDYYDIYYSPVQTRQEILRILNACENPKKVIPPRGWEKADAKTIPWKCRKCPDEHRNICQFYQRWVETFGKS